MRSGDSTNIVGKDVAAFSASSGDDTNIDVVSRCGIFEAGAAAIVVVVVLVFFWQIAAYKFLF